MLNITRTHPVFNMKKQVEKICQSLFLHTGINYFTLSRFYYDGKCTVISNEHDYDYTIFKNNLLPSFAEMINNKSHYAIISDKYELPEAVVASNPMAQNVIISTQFNIHDRFFLTFKQMDCIELMAFSIRGNKKNVIEFYINHLEILEKFCAYFRIAAKELIDTAEQNKIIFEEKISVNAPLSDFKPNDNYEDFIKSITPKKLIVQGKLGSCLLTKREIECLLMIAKNKSAKEISQILCLSPRTIESHFANIKGKLGLTYKSELYEMIVKDPLLKILAE